MKVVRVRGGDAPVESPRAHRWIRQSLWLLLLLLLLPVTSPWWSQALRGEVEGDDDEATPVPEAATRRLPTPTPTPAFQGVLYVPDVREGGLRAVRADIPYVRDMASQVRAVLEALSLEHAGGPPLLPKDTRVLDVVFVASTGALFVDLTAEFESGRSLGADAEADLVGGLLRTLNENFQAVRSVQILVDGRAPGPGHLDLSRPIRRDDPAFASPVAEAVAGPAPTPSPLPLS